MTEPPPSPGTGLRTSTELDPAIQAVEVKITARVEDEDRVLALLERAKLEPVRRTVYFFDTPALALLDAGLVLRARKVADRGDDSTVKLRPVDPARISPAWIGTRGFEVEMDRVGDTEVISAKLAAAQSRGEIDAVVAGARALYRLFSRDQERLIAEFGPSEVGWEQLVVMGPIDVRTWEVDWDDLRHEVFVERWQLPDGSDLVELSIRVSPGEVSTASQSFREVLVRAGIEVDGDQETKTRAALAFFTTGEGFDE